MNLSDCTLCPRNCHVDRTAKKTGVCGQTDDIYIARAALHMWEEPCISGSKGSGTVFFSGCNMGCVFCQNYEIAHNQVGKKVSISYLSQIFLKLQSQGANNINLVTPTHYIPQIKEALLLSKKNGLRLPIVYNTSAYENVSSLQMLEGLIDIYLPDLKYFNSALSAKYSHAADYFAKASIAIAEMVRQTGSPVFRADNGQLLTASEYDDKAILQRGTIVRHLLLPNCLDDSMEVIKYLYNTFGNHIFISIMSQFTPLEHTAAFPELNRKVTEEEYTALVNYAIELGVENGFIQEGDIASESFIPDFDCDF